MHHPDSTNRPDVPTEPYGGAAVGAERTFPPSRDPRPRGSMNEARPFLSRRISRVSIPPPDSRPGPDPPAAQPEAAWPSPEAGRTRRSAPRRPFPPRDTCVLPRAAAAYSSSASYRVLHSTQPNLKHRSFGVVDWWGFLAVWGGGRGHEAAVERPRWPAGWNAGSMRWHGGTRNAFHL